MVAQGSTYEVEWRNIRKLQLHLVEQNLNHNSRKAKEIEYEDYVADERRFRQPHQMAALTEIAPP